MHATPSIPARRGRLSWQMFIGLVVILLATMTVAVQYIHRYTMDILSQRDERIALDQVHSAQSRMNQIMGTLYSNMDVLLHDSDISAIASRRTSGMDYELYTQVKAVHAHISALARNYDYIASVYVYINDSVMIGTNITNSAFPYSSDAIPVLHTDFYRSLGDTPYKIKSTAAFRLSDFHAYKEYSRAAQNGCITLGSAGGGERSGNKRIILLNLDPQKIGALLSSFFGDDGAAYLLDADHAVLCASDGTLPSALPFALPQSPASVGQLDVSVEDEPGQAVYAQIQGGDYYIVKHLPSSQNLKEANTIGAVFLVAFLICCAVSLALVLAWIRRCLMPIGIICGKMMELESGKLGVQIDLAPRNELGDVIWHFNRMSVALARMDAESRQAEKALRVQEIRALRAQMNPHFIFNTLNMFKWMAILHKAEDLTECIVALAEILYPVFKEKAETIPIKNEIGFLGKYLLILSHRFENQVDLEITLPMEVEDALVPKLLLQPVVENCVQHGRYADGRLLRVRVQARREGDDLEVTVQDDGQGMSGSRLQELQASIAQTEISAITEGDHIGLLNVHRRIALQYGQQYGLTLNSQWGQGATVRIRLPFQQMG